MSNLNNNSHTIDKNTINFKDESSITMLKDFILKIEKLQNEKDDLLKAISEIFTDAKNEGFDVKIMKKIIQMRKIENNKRIEEETILEHYKTILGMK